MCSQFFCLHGTSTAEHRNPQHTFDFISHEDYGYFLGGLLVLVISWRWLRCCSMTLKLNWQLGDDGHIEPTGKISATCAHFGGLNNVHQYWIMS